MNSKTIPEYLQIQSLLEGLERACADESLYVTLRLARQASDIFRTITATTDNGLDVFDVMALLKGANAHDETTGAQRAIIAVTVNALEALATGPYNPSDMDWPTPATQPGTVAHQLDYETVLEHGGELAKSVLLSLSSDVEACAEALFQQAHNVEFEGELTAAALIRTYASRIKSMISLVISYVGPDSITLDDAFTAIHGPNLGTDMLSNQLERERQRQAETSMVVAPEPAYEADFMAGVKLAVKMIRKGEAIGKDVARYDLVNLLDMYRQDSNDIDHPQNNFALSAVMKVAGSPAMAEGFAAVLSDCFGNPDGVNTIYLESDLTYAKIKGDTVAGPSVTTPSAEDDYMEGLGLAIDIWRAVGELSGDEVARCELDAKYRPPKTQQNNVALGFVQMVMDCPQLIEGFAAGLSCIAAASCSGSPSPDEFAALSYSDITRTLTAKQAQKLIEQQHAEIDARQAQDAAHAVSEGERAKEKKVSRKTPSKKPTIKSGSSAVPA